MPTLHTLLFWSLMVIEVKFSMRHFLTPSSSTWVEKTEEKPMQVTALGRKPAAWGSCPSADSQPGPPCVLHLEEWKAQLSQGHGWLVRVGGL